MTFVISTLVLLLGPFLFMLGERHHGSRQALDGFVLITLAGIVCLHIVPEAWRVAGPVSLVFLLLGLGFPVALEAIFSKALRRAHLFVVVIAAAGIVVHAVVDGIALLPLADDGGLLENQLAIGVILHRLPVGMAIWWALRPQFGTAVALATFGVVIGVTGVSYYYGADLIGGAQARSLAYFQSFVAGSLVHLVLFGINHDHDADEAHQGKKMDSWSFRVGLLLGLVVVFLLPHIHTG